MNKPIQIVMTPTRNEAWCLQAFLEATSQWADYLIIADQMSTDRTRDIIDDYAKRNAQAGICEIILIDNKNPDFNEAERQSMLVAKAREVAAGRDTLLWGLDADEILAANFRQTEDWNHIMNSKPGDVFWFKWAEICPNKQEYWLSPSIYFPWLFHDDGKEPHGNYVRNMHSMRIPYPIEEKQMYYVDDFRVLHLAYLNIHRVESKRRFYQFVDWEMNHRSPITLSRSYTQTERTKLVKPITNDMLYKDFDCFGLVDTEVTKCYMDEYIVDRLNRHKSKQTRKLDIWNEHFCETYNLADPRTIVDKMIHSWLHSTNIHKNNYWVRTIDMVLKLLY